MASKRIDELTTRSVVNTDLLPPTPTGGPSGSATVAAVVKAGLSQPNSASSGAGASITIKAADGVTSGAGGNIILTPGVQATTGGDGIIQAKSDIILYQKNSSENVEFRHGGDAFNLSPSYSSATFNTNVFFKISAGNFLLLEGRQASGGGSICCSPATTNVSTNQNNLSLTASGFQRINCTSNSDITGISCSVGASPSGRMIRIVNVGTATLTIKHNSSSSTAANRVFCSTGADISLASNSWADFIYDSTDNGSGAAGWRAK